MFSGAHSENLAKSVVNWFMLAEETLSTGIALHVFPYKNHALVPFELEAAIHGLNPVVAIKLHSSLVLTAMAKVYTVPPR